MTLRVATRKEKGIAITKRTFRRGLEWRPGRALGSAGEDAHDIQYDVRQRDPEDGAEEEKHCFRWGHTRAHGRRRIWFPGNVESLFLRRQSQKRCVTALTESLACRKYCFGMFTNTVILTGTVVIEGSAFRWSVTDGLAQQLMVSHAILGTQTQPLAASPASQARIVGRAMLKDAAHAAAVGFVDEFDVAPISNGDPEPTIF
jgi:hypothetical protein